jgi:hypothetical protein
LAASTSGDDQVPHVLQHVPPCSIDSDLARILDAWPTLPEPIRRAMLGLVESGR